MSSYHRRAPTGPQVNSVLLAASDRSRVSGLTHDFYRYPARFSPKFARAAIEQFTSGGDVVMDPFMGGGTSIVEARALGRRAIGADTSALAVFVARTKTTPLSANQTMAVSAWIARQAHDVRVSGPALRPSDWARSGYHRNFSGRRSWPIRKFLEIALSDIESLCSPAERRFARAVLLRTAQWAVDTRRRPHALSSVRVG